jgi:hypothetical protein
MDRVAIEGVRWTNLIWHRLAAPATKPQRYLCTFQLAGRAHRIRRTQRAFIPRRRYRVEEGMSPSFGGDTIAWKEQGRGTAPRRNLDGWERGLRSIGPRTWRRAASARSARRNQMVTPVLRGSPLPNGFDRGGCFFFSTWHQAMLGVLQAQLSSLQ